jgi:hypothetical protein
MRVLAGSTLLLLSLLSPPVSAWTLPVERSLARAALELGPPDLARLAVIHERALEEGLLDAARHEQQSVVTHLGVDRRPLESLLQREIDEAVAIMKNRRPVEELVYQLGVIAHLTGDLNHPIHLGREERMDGRRSDFEQYMERSLPRFPTVFYGIEPTRSPERVIRQARARAEKYEPLLRSQYFGRGEERWSRQFDDRSTAFAIASLSWSHAVTDLTNIYYIVWQRAGGDVRRADRLRPGVVSRNGGSR